MMNIKSYLDQWCWLILLGVGVFSLQVQADCDLWNQSKNYNVGDKVSYQGNDFIAVNANPGYVPTISTWFWDPDYTGCDSDETIWYSRIQAEDYYDYYDTTSGNTGSQYRNDDVDIEVAYGSDYNIGWTAQGEWLKYGLNNFGGGRYYLNVNTATPENSATFDVYLNSVYQDSLYAPSTGDWQSWNIISSKAIDIPAGDHTIEIRFTGDSLNLDWIEVSDQQTNAGENTGNDCGTEWYQARLTNYTSYPDPGSEECIAYNGCWWAGQFAGLSGVQPEWWVQQNNIAAVHSKDFSWLSGKTLKLRQGSKEIDVVVYDMCSDSDCNGCCTANLGSTGFLIDIEKYTMQRFGSGSGTVDWQVCY